MIWQPIEQPLSVADELGALLTTKTTYDPTFFYPMAHAPGYVEAKGVELVAGVDLLPDQLEDFKRRWGVNALYTDYRQMLANEKPDIVSVTTRPAERAEVVIGTAEAGGVKAIYATKPISPSLAEADAMIEACRKHGVLLVIACHQNWSPWFLACLEAIRAGEIGKLTSMLCSYMHGGHTLSLFRLFADAPAKWVVGHIDSDNRRSGMILYENDVRGSSPPVAGINSISSEATVGSPPATSTPTLRCGPAIRIAPSVLRPENPFAGSFPTQSASSVLNKPLLKHSSKISTKAQKRCVPGNTGVKPLKSVSRCGNRTCGVVRNSNCP